MSELNPVCYCLNSMMEIRDAKSSTHRKHACAILSPNQCQITDCGHATANFFYVDMHILGTVLFIVVVVVMKVTSPHSFILFQPLSGKKAIFRRVPGGPFWAIFVM